MYAFKRKLTISYLKCGTADSSDFPFYFPGASYLATVANGGGVQDANGYDIGFYADAALTTKLAWEMVSYSASTGLGEWHIRVPVLSASVDTVIYVAYGDASVVSNPSSTGAWASSFRFVAHLANGTVLSAADSTAFANNGTNGDTGAAPGKLNGGGASCNGVSSDKIITPYAEQLADLTASAWFRAAGVGNAQYDRIIDKNYQYGLCICRTANNNNSWSVYFRNVGSLDPLTIALNDGDWHLIKAKRSGTTLTLSANGGAVIATKTVDTTAISGDPLRIGCSPASDFYNSFLGVIDEVRMMNVATSTSYDTAEYNNQSSPSTFFATGAEQALATAGGSALFWGD